MNDRMPEITPENDDLPILIGDAAAALYANSLGVPVTARWVRSESEANRLASNFVGRKKAFSPADVRGWLRHANKREAALR